MNNRYFLHNESDFSASRTLLSSTEAHNAGLFPLCRLRKKIVAAGRLGRLQNKKTADYPAHCRSYHRVRLSMPARLISYDPFKRLKRQFGQRIFFANPFATISMGR